MLVTIPSNRCGATKASWNTVALSPHQGWGNAEMGDGLVGFDDAIDDSGNGEWELVIYHAN